MSTPSAEARPEPWLRGPLPGIPAALQPAGHALTMALEDAQAAVEAIAPDQVWLMPGGAASIGFHLLHLSGSTDRLFTYARGAKLSLAQLQALAAEAEAKTVRPPLAGLLALWIAAVDRALRQLSETSEATLLEPRAVGRAQSPSTVIGLLFHAAEHAERHVGQLVTTAKIVRGLDLHEPI